MKLLENNSAINDYVICFEKLFDHVDYFVVNVSSPNTPWLSNFYVGYNDSLREVIFPDSMYNFNWYHNYSTYLPGLGNIDIYNCPNLDSIILPSNYNIRGLYADGNTSLSYIDLSNQTYIDYLVLSYCDSLQSIDVSNNPYLNTLRARHIENLTELDLRNGNIVNLNYKTDIFPNL